MNVILSGGGTGGHIYPGLAIAEALKSKHPDWRILFAGTPSGLEAQVIPQQGFDFRPVDVQGFKRRISLYNVVTLVKALGACAQSLRLFGDFRPDIVIGTGGYVCGPVLLCAALKGIPTLIQEQNAFPGVTNRILARFVQRVAVAYPESVSFFRSPQKVVVTGNPIRSEILERTREDGLKSFGLDSMKNTLLVLGGSHGARTINDAMLGAMQEFSKEKHLQIIWTTGNADYERVMKVMHDSDAPWKGVPRNVLIRPYLTNIDDAYAVANLVVSRGGAISLAEMTAKGLPLIIVPYPYATDNHQEYNAQALVRKGASIMIRDRDLTSEELLTKVKWLLGNPKELMAMSRRSLECGRPSATAEVVECIENMILIDSY